ncbi:hypothetical protein EV121DRAFT_218936 [Schizophyllum commune]
MPLTRDAVLVQLSSGYGHFLVQAAVEVGCTVYGVEATHAMCEASAGIAYSASLQTGASMGAVIFEQASSCTGLVRRELVSLADLVIVDNRSFGPAGNRELFESVLLSLKHGAALIATAEFLGGGPLAWYHLPHKQGFLFVRTFFCLSCRKGSRFVPDS